MTSSSSLAARLRRPYRAALAAVPLAGAGSLAVAQLRPAPPLADDLHALLSAASVGACFAAMVVSRALLRPERVEEAEDPARHIYSSFLVTWALCVAGSLAGAALCALTGQPGDLAPSAAVSLLTALAHPPTEARVRAALGARR